MSSLDASSYILLYDVLVSHQRLTSSVVGRYAVGSLTTGGYGTLPGLVLVYYLTDSLAVSAAIAGLIITTAKVWDVIIDPFIGGLSDRIAEKRGTRKPLMIVGAIGLPLTFIATFSVPAGLSPALSAAWVFVAFIASATFFSLFQIPYMGMPAELTSSYSERSRLLMWRVIIISVSILAVGTGGPAIRAMFSNPHMGYLVMAIVCGLLFLVGTIFSTSVSPRIEPSQHELKTGFADYYLSALRALKESQPFRALLATWMTQALTTGTMLAAVQFIAAWILQDEAAVMYVFICLIGPAIIFAPIWKKLADSIGKERAFGYATLTFIAAALSLVPMIWFPGYWILAAIALSGVGYAGMQALPMSMLPDVISYDAEQRGQSRGGVLAGLFTAGETIGLALGTTLMTIVLSISGYVESDAETIVEQPQAVLTGIAMTFSVIPVILLSISLVLLSRYKLRRDDIETVIEPDVRESI